MSKLGKRFAIVGGALFATYLAIFPGCGSVPTIIINETRRFIPDLVIRYAGDEVWHEPNRSGRKTRLPVRWGGGALAAEAVLAPSDSRGQPIRLKAESLMIPTNVYPYVLFVVLENDRLQIVPYTGFVHSDAEPGTWWWSILNGTKHGLAVMSCPLKGVIPYATFETRDAICRAVPFLCPAKREAATT